MEHSICILALCPLLSIVVHLELSCLIPSQAATSLGIVFASISMFFFCFFFSSKTGDNCAQAIAEFSLLREAKCRVLAASSGSSVLPILSCAGGSLRKRFLKLVLRDQRDFLDESIVLSWLPTIDSDLMWWSDARHLPAGVSVSLLNQIFSFDPLCRITVGGGGGTPSRPICLRSLV